MSKLYSGRLTMTNAANNGTNVIPLDDTREKLWTDCEDLIRRIQKRLFGGRDETALRCQFAELLDREKAITERECIDRWDAKATLEIAELRAKVNELTAELEEARKRHMENEDQLAEENDALIAKVDELTEERDQLLDQAEEYAEEAANFEQSLADIEQTHMRLPVDADGVPIRPGDYMALGDSRGEVKALSYAPYNELPWQMQLDDYEWYVTVNARHVQPDTVESLLEEFYGKTHATTAEEREELAAEYAERIRRACNGRS